MPSKPNGLYRICNFFCQTLYQFFSQESSIGHILLGTLFLNILKQDAEIRGLTSEMVMKDLKLLIPIMHLIFSSKVGLVPISLLTLLHCSNPVLFSDKWAFWNKNEQMTPI